MKTTHRATFGGRLSAVLVTAGSAVGLGNIWRFPYVAGENGGGAFLLIYILSVLLLGVPIMLSEFAIGRNTHRNAVGAYRTLSSRWSILGYNSILAPLLIMGFYLVVSGWTLEYMIHSLTGEFTRISTPEAYESLFNAFTQNPWKPLLYTVVFTLLTHGVIALGVQKGIERSARIMMPLLLLILVVLAVHSILLPGGTEGVKFLFVPDFSKVTPSTVLTALGQAFFSLSIGLATTNAQSVEVSLVNYLWPTLLVLMTAAVSHKRGAVAKAIPGAVIATIGVAMAVGGESLDMQEAVHNIASNPLPYVLAFVGAFIWAIYATFTPSLSGGYDGTTIFFCCVAVVLWTIHFVSGDGLPDTAPGIGGYAALIACAASISGGYACWGYGMLHGSMETLAIGSYATPLFSTASSTLLLGVALGMPFWIGVVLVVAGSLINVWFARCP